MLQQILFVTYFSVGFQWAVAQTSESSSKTVADSLAPQSSFSVNGIVDVFYKYDFANTKKNSYTSFTTLHNSFTLAMASIKAQHKTAKTEVLLDIGIGQRVKEFSYNETDVLQAIKQLYVTYKPNKWLKFTAGTWTTHVGYEMLDASSNKNYNMSYLFTNGPFSHTGIKAEAAKGKSNFMIGVSNATDYRIQPQGFLNKKFLIAQYNYNPTKKTQLYFNYVGGKNKDSSVSQQIDVVAAVKASTKFNVAVNATLGSVKAHYGSTNKPIYWGGAALYTSYDVTNKVTIANRVEYFNDKKQLKTFIAATKGDCIVENVFSLNIKKENLLIIPEFRIDYTKSNDIFINKKELSSNRSCSFVIAAIYSF